MPFWFSYQTEQPQEGCFHVFAETRVLGTPSKQIISKPQASIISPHTAQGPRSMVHAGRSVSLGDPHVILLGLKGPGAVLGELASWFQLAP